MTAKRALIMAGGTGGHIFPGLAVAEELKSRGYEVRWLGTREGMESTLVPNAGIDIRYIPVKGIRGKSLKTLVLAPWNVLSSVLAAWKVVKSLKPNVVVGLGGFVAGPGGVAAKLRSIPLVIHEQNAVPGTTNRMLAKIASRVLCAFPCGLSKGVCIGNPVRKEIESIEKEANDDGLTRVLIVGGSRGALAINELVPDALATINTDTKFEVWHQAGKDKDEQTKTRYVERGVEAKVAAFIDDMAEAYSWADLVVCRAGALTVSELAAVGLPAVLIPYPYAIDDHQTANAKYLADHGAAEIYQQRDLSVDKLAATLQRLLADRGLLNKMAERAKSLAKLNTTGVFADYCDEVVCG